MSREYQKYFREDEPDEPDYEDEPDEDEPPNDYVEEEEEYYTITAKGRAYLFNKAMDRLEADDNAD